MGNGRYRNAIHQSAYQLACQMASVLVHQELDLDAATTKIVREIRTLDGMYHKAKLCKDIARKALESARDSLSQI